MSFYQVTNTKNIGKSEVEEKNYDLMTLVVIRLGDSEYHGERGDEGFELLHFLNTVMYPHREDFMEIVSDYIDFSENEELWKEEPRMFSLSQCIYEDGMKDGIEQGIVKGIEQGITQGIEQGIIALVQDHLEENIPREKTIYKLQKHFSLTREKAEECYGRYARDI